MLERGEAPVPPGVTRNDDVVRVGLRHPSGDRAYPALRNQLDADRRARIHPLQVEDQLGQIFNGVNVMMRRRADERDPGLRMTQAGDQLGHLVAGELATFARLRSLGDLDLNLLGMASRYSVVTPKRADATCFTLLLRIAGAPG